MAATSSRKTVLAALAANAGIAVAKFLGFAVTLSSSMLAEAVHSVADTSNQALLLWGERASKRTPDSEHPFGYGAERFFWSFIVALVLFSLGALFALYEGIEKLQHPHAIENAFVAVVILLVAIVLETLSFRTAIKESNKIRADMSWRKFLRETRVPELAVVVLEDFGALVGLGLALSGVTLSITTRNSMYDGWATIAIAALLGTIAIVLAIEMKGLLIGEAAQPDVIRRAWAAAAEDPDVRHVIHMRTLHLGPEDLLVAAKIDIDPRLNTDETALVIDRVEAQMRAAVPIARHIYLEPDVYDATLGDT